MLHPPPALRLGSVLPIFGPFHCGSCGRYPYTLRSDWALLLCCGFGGLCLSYRCPPLTLLVGMGAAITDSRRSRGPYLAVCWHMDIPTMGSGGCASQRWAAKVTELNRHTTRMKIRGSAVSQSFIFPHPPEDERRENNNSNNTATCSRDTTTTYLPV